MRRGSGLIALSLAAAALLAPTGIVAATPEAQVKAAYLYKLASFVRWPEQTPPPASFRICIAGRSDIASIVQTLARGQRIGQSAVTVEQLTAVEVQRARGCQLLYLGRGGNTARSLMAATRGRPVLTVGDRNNGTGGAVIDFVIRDGRVRLTVDRGKAAAQQLELNSKLMDVAVEVAR